MPVTSGLPKKVLIVGAGVFGREARRESQLAGRLALKTGRLLDEVRLQGAGEVGVLDFEADRAGPTGGRLEARIDRLVVAVDVP